MAEEKVPASVYSYADVPDDVIQAVEDEIKHGVDARDLMGKREKVDVLLEEYKTNQRFLKKIDELRKSYGEIRRVRGDGNCFYRAYIFSCMEWLATSSDQKAKEEFINILTFTKDKLIAQGLSDFVVEDFWENLMNEVSWVQTSHPTIDEIMEHFNDRNLSDYLVSYARIITSSHLKTHADQFLPFIQGVSIQAFVSAEVEPMGKECDYVQCVALATEFGVPVRIEYLDQSDTPLNHHDIPEKSKPVFYLLYRPGHYDVLYPIGDKTIA